MAKVRRGRVHSPSGRRGTSYTVSYDPDTERGYIYGTPEYEAYMRRVNARNSSVGWGFRTAAFRLPRNR